MLQPKRTKFRKAHKGRIHGNAKGGTSLAFGQYALKAVVISGDTVTTKTLLSDYEVYNLTVDPADSSRLLFDGLNFASNTYRFGSIDPNAEDGEASVEDKDGLTGQIKTLIIVPSF